MIIVCTILVVGAVLVYLGTRYEAKRMLLATDQKVAPDLSVVPVQTSPSHLKNKETEFDAAETTRTHDAFLNTYKRRQVSLIYAHYVFGVCRKTETGPYDASVDLITPMIRGLMVVCALVMEMAVAGGFYWYLHDVTGDFSDSFTWISDLDPVREILMASIATLTTFLITLLYTLLYSQAPKRHRKALFISHVALILLFTAFVAVMCFVVFNERWHYIWTCCFIICALAELIIF
jgi:hypothetical protein